MDNRNKHSSGDERLDNILEQAKHRGAPDAKRDSLDTILAGITAKNRKEAAKNSQGSAAQKKPAPSFESKDLSAVQNVAKEDSSPKKQPVQNISQQEPTQKKPPASLFGEDTPTKSGTDAFAQSTAKPPVDLFADAFPKQSDTKPSTTQSTRIVPTVKPKKSDDALSSLWQANDSHTRSIPRLGKAAALDKVSPDKYAGDEELLSWFSGQEELSRKEQKRADRQDKKLQNAQRKEDKRRSKQGFDVPDAPLQDKKHSSEANDIFDTKSSNFGRFSLSEEPMSAPEKQHIQDFLGVAPNTPPQNPFFDIEKEGDEASSSRKRKKSRKSSAKQTGVPPDETFLFENMPPRTKGAVGVSVPITTAVKGASLFGDGATPSAPKSSAPTQKPLFGETPSADTAVFKPLSGTQGAPAPKADTTAVKGASLFGESAPSAPKSSAPTQKPLFGETPSADTAVFKPLGGTQGAPAPKADTTTVKGASLFGESAPSAPKSSAPTQKPLFGETPSADTAVFKPLGGTQGAPAPKADTTAVKGASLFGESAPSAPKSSAPTQKPLFDETPSADTAVFKPISNVPKEDEPLPFSTQMYDLGDIGKAEGATSSSRAQNTRSYDLNNSTPSRTPTASHTQEFDADKKVSPSDTPNKNLFVDEMVDERFRDFFKETMIVEQGQEIPEPKARRKKRRGRTAILTGEFSKLAEMAKQAEEDEQKATEEGFDDYSKPQDADAVEWDIASLCSTLTRRFIITAVIGVLLLWVGLGFGQNAVWLPEMIAFEFNPMVFSAVYLVLILGAMIVNFTTIACGIVGLFGEPSVDCAPSLACVVALLQGIVLIVPSDALPPTDIVLYGALAAFLLAFNALGKRIRAGSILRNFQLASAGYDHCAAFVVDNQNDIAHSITKGLHEDEPVMLISRPTALVKGFLRQSFSLRGSDRTGRVIAWVLLAFSLAGGVMSFFFTGSLLVAVSCLAGVMCVGAPLSSSLVSAIPSTLLQRATSRVGAVVPGWSAIEELGKVNVVMVTAKDLFPTSSISLRGIKTFEKERIDLAILYASSVLIEGCDTLRDVFKGVIQGKSDILYKVESLSCEPGRGFTAWVENSRVVIGSREMLQRHDITPPPIETELKHVPTGHMPIYLAVSGKLFAMFIVSYSADTEVQQTLDSLVHSGISLLIQSDDMNVTEELVERTYDLPGGSIKVLGRHELNILEPLTSYIPESEGVMTHVGNFASFIGGMRAAASCAMAERMSSIVQISSVALITLLCMLLIFSGAGVLGLSVIIGLLYQVGWTVLSSLLPFTRRY